MPRQFHPGSTRVCVDLSSSMGSAASLRREDSLQKSFLSQFPEVPEAGLVLQGDRVQALDADEWEAQLGEFCRELRKKYMEDGENPKSVREPLGFQLSRPAS
ncbi:unnamed protein product [Durusdinium trenchii]|uniref:Selenoprotein O n=1 Tax=Durusdinium trenchii TaxID=1381693 RepID=A0ABP0QTE7_9DINO